MRIQALLLASVLWCLAPLSTRAQVSVDTRALDQLKPPPGEAASPDKAPARGRPTQRPTSERNTRAASARPTPPPAKPAPPKAAEIYGPPRPPPPAPLAAAAPPLPVIPPPIEVPTRPIPPPLPPTIVKAAPGDVVRTKDGLRVTFGPGSADLNTATDGAVRDLADGLPPFDTAIYTLTAYARPEADDPSTPRRLALSRALAVRSVLIEKGVTSPRIIVKVAAATPVSASDAPPDRVDISVARPASFGPASSGPATPEPPPAAAAAHKR